MKDTAVAPRRQPELLAPAGDRDALKAALLAGADAIYLGGRRFGARAFAANFDHEGLRWARRVTQARQRKLYLTVNTLVFDREWPLLQAELDFLEELRPDAIIVQDLGVLEELRRRGSTLERHLSTQGAWDGAGGHALLRELQVSRVILPRETSAARIAAIQKSLGDLPLSLEVFVHGAHCFSFSGRCWWSVALGTRSGNRGTCAQPCRQEYRPCAWPEPNSGRGPDAPPVRTRNESSGSASEPGKKPQPWFSPKDLRLLGQVGQLTRLGVASLKIEGRMKDAAYVARVVSTYRAVLDGAPVERARLDELDAVFTREVDTGFFAGRPQAWRTCNGVGGGTRGQPVGAVVRPAGPDGLVTVTLTVPVKAGDGLAWATPDGQRHGGRVTYVDRSGAGERRLRFLGAGPAMAGVALVRTNDPGITEILTGWRSEWEAEPVTLAVAGALGQSLTARFSIGGRQGEIVSSEPLLAATGQGLEAVLSEKITDLAGRFRVSQLDLNGLAKGLFLPPKALKAWRRALVDAVTAAADGPPGGRADPGGAARNGVSGGANDPAATAVSLGPVASGGADVVRGPVPVLAAGRTTTWAVRLWQVPVQPEPLAGLRPPGGWILPDGGDEKQDKVLQRALSALPGRIRRWLPPMSGPDEVAAYAARLADLPAQEFLCLSWEALGLAQRLPQHRFTLDWTFNLVNTLSVAVVRRHGVAAVNAGCECPEPLAEAAGVVRWFPLVSLNRWPPEAAVAQRPVANPHGDLFVQVPLGRDWSGLFLVDGKPRVPAGSWSQLDLLVPPGLATADIVRDVQQWLREAQGSTENPGRSTNA